jgi:hypothetical protein
MQIHYSNKKMESQAPVVPQIKMLLYGSTLKNLAQSGIIKRYCGRGQAVRHQPSKLIFASSNLVARSFVLNPGMVAGWMTTI